MIKTLREGCVRTNAQNQNIFSRYSSWPMFQVFTLHSLGTITKAIPNQWLVCVCKLSRVSWFLTQTISRVWWITQQDSLSRSETSLVCSYVNLNCFGFQLSIVTWNCENKHCHTVTQKLRFVLISFLHCDTPSNMVFFYYDFFIQQIIAFAVCIYWNSNGWDGKTFWVDSKTGKNCPSQRGDIKNWK